MAVLRFFVVWNYSIIIPLFGGYVKGKAKFSPEVPVFFHKKSNSFFTFYPTYAIIEAVYGHSFGTVEKPRRIPPSMRKTARKETLHERILRL